MNETYKDKVSGRTLYVRRISGATNYYKDPERTILHREDGPAREFTSGSWTWCQNGMVHRMDGPAMFYRHNSPLMYYINGVPIDKEVLTP
jgi:hypothetical protein